MLCPLCKSGNSIEASRLVPRLEEGLRACTDCGLVFVDYIPEWARREVEAGVVRSPFNAIPPPVKSE